MPCQFQQAMGYTLLISEKPKAAQKIAEALASGPVEKKSSHGISYYEFKHGSAHYVIAPAVGHLFGLAEKDKKHWHYPVFSIEWKPIYEVDKGAGYTKKYYDVLKSLAKKAEGCIGCTDYDIEGELIALNIVRYICGRKDAERMKFSTLTKPDLLESFNTRSKHLDWGQAYAGEVRHKLDWYYGINLSRALTSAIKAAGMFKILSSGRVQGPALKIVVDREREIAAFKPRQYWQIELHGEVKAGKITALHSQDKFWDKQQADAIFAKVKGKKAEVAELARSELKIKPPVPFDLTSLQMEAYRWLRISPKETMEISQELYTSGLISYPRTSSQQLPPTIGYAKILTQLSKQFTLASKLIKKKLEPNNGKKTDPAHPAIYPTGILPKKLEGHSAKLYDLIVKRFMATFADDCLRESLVIKISVDGEIFLARGSRILHEGWREYYAPYIEPEEQPLPACTKGEPVAVKKIDLLEDQTKPPKRYTPASIIKDLEKRNLGTKATRSEIVETLFHRGYIEGKQIKATDLGIHTVETLEKYCPEILDEELTRHFEEEMDEIREKAKPGTDVLDEAQAILTKILAKFKEKEKDIGAGLLSANRETVEKANTVGKCPLDDGTLMIKRGKFGRFIACSNYPDCKATFKLPTNGLVKTSTLECQQCKHPMIGIIRKAKKPQELCINPDCPSKKSDASFVADRTCPKCGVGKMVQRKSIYGSFVACDQYPKCRNIEKKGL